MAKNLGREYATMSEDERRKFALEAGEGSGELPAELAFEEPRNQERMGQQYQSQREETADPEHRDGLSAQLDDKQHQQAVNQASTGRESVEDSEAPQSRTHHA